MYTYLNPKCGDVSLEYWGCAKTHFLEHIDKANVLVKREKPFNFLSDSRKFIVLQQIDSGFKLGILWKPIDLSDARSVEIYRDANDIGPKVVKFSFYILLRKKYNKTNEPMGANITGLHLAKLSSRCFLL